MGCQSAITELILSRKSSYILALKENQSSLLEQVKYEFTFSKSETTIKGVDYGHGRIETRKCSVISDFKDLENYEKWKNLTSIIKIESVREFKTKKKRKGYQILYLIAKT